MLINFNLCEVIIMKFINYNDMKDFYTVDELCRLFEMDKSKLRRYSEKYQIAHQEDQYGNCGFRKQLVRKLHNYIYKEQKNAGSDQSVSSYGRRTDPWA